MGNEIEKKEKTSLLDYAEEIDKFATSNMKNEELLKGLSKICGMTITKEIMRRLSEKMFGSTELKGLCAGHRRRIAEYLVMRCRLGYDISMDVVRNLDKVRETGGMLIEIMKVALTDLALNGSPREILKYVPQSVWQDYFLAGISGGKGINQGIDKMMMQLPIVAGAEERGGGEEKEIEAEVIEKKDRRGILDDLLE